MKKGLSLFVVSLMVLTIFSGCSLFTVNDFEEATLTLVNDSEFDLYVISLDNGYSGLSSKSPEYMNLLTDGSFLASGDRLLMGLTPVLHEDSYAKLYIDREDNRGVQTYYYIDFTYDEGADVIVTFDPTATETWNLENAEEYVPSVT